MKREKTVSGSGECLFSRKVAGLLGCFCCKLFLFIIIFPFFSPTHTIAHFGARSKVLYFLYPSLKFLSSHNSLRNFFSPSRGEIKILHLAASLPSFLAASDTDFTSKSALLDSTPLSNSLPRREDFYRFHLSGGRGRSRLRTDVSITNSREG